MDSTFLGLFRWSQCWYAFAKALFDFFANFLLKKAQTTSFNKKLSLLIKSTTTNDLQPPTEKRAYKIDYHTHTAKGIVVKDGKSEINRLGKLLIDSCSVRNCLMRANFPRLLVFFFEDILQFVFFGVCSAL